jgi:hypothetical protein
VVDRLSAKTVFELCEPRKGSVTRFEIGPRRAWRLASKAFRNPGTGWKDILMRVYQNIS